MATTRHHYNEDPEIVEIGVDEVGRGPLFGRVYVAAAILPKHSDTYTYSLMKDSKRFSSHKKLNDAYQYILENCTDWTVKYEDEAAVDSMNILQATQKAMHDCVQELIDRNNLNPDKTLLLIDGNYFKCHNTWNKKRAEFECYTHECIKGGDNLYSSIAAASIIAKVSRDSYIENMCDDHPELDERYLLRGNKGYAATQHREGIMKYGLSPWHRKTFGLCKQYTVNNEYDNIDSG
jgi:ribonuclease HII